METARASRISASIYSRARYVASVIAVGVAVLVRLAFADYFSSDLPYITLLPVVAIVALFAGPGPALLSTVLSTLLAAYWIVEPHGQFEGISAQNAIGLAAFTGTSLLLTAVAWLYRRAQGSASALEKQLILRESAERFRIMLDAIPSLTLEHDGEGNNIFANERWCSYTGMTLAESQGSGWLDAIHPDDAGEMTAKWLAAVRDGSPYESKHRLRAADGSYRWFIARALPGRDAKGKIACWFASMTDIDDVVRAEQSLRHNERRHHAIEHVARLAAEMASFYTYDFRPITGELIWSDATRQLFGLPPGESPNLELFLKTVHPDDRERVSNAFLAAMSPESGGDYAIEHRLIVNGGSEVRWIKVRGKTFFDEHNRAIRAIGGSVDITEHKRIDRLRDQLLGIVGHDLRGPITATKLATAMVLKRGALKSEDAELLRTIARSTDRMGRLIHQLLDFTRASFTGGFVLEKERVDLADLCRHIARESELAHPDHEVRIDARGDCSGLWDASRLSEVLSNLLGNAARHGRPRAPIDVTLRGEGSDVIVDIHNENDGAPIPEDVLPVIFAAFRGGTGQPRDTPRSGEGLGLGLYISKEIVAAHGGEISARSSERDGTTFSVRLPRA